MSIKKSRGGVGKHQSRGVGKNQSRGGVGKKKGGVGKDQGGGPVEATTIGTHPEMENVLVTDTGRIPPSTTSGIIGTVMGVTHGVDGHVGTGAGIERGFAVFLQLP